LTRKAEEIRERETEKERDMMRRRKSFSKEERR
jgi:hypothetical protein